MLISELISMHGISYVLFNYVSSQAVEIKCTLDSFFLFPLVSLIFQLINYIILSWVWNNALKYNNYTDLSSVEQSPSLKNNGKFIDSSLFSEKRLGSLEAFLSTGQNSWWRIVFIIISL